MSKIGKITFKSKDKSGYFYYSFKISDYHATKILEYIAQVPHTTTRVVRDTNGRFIAQQPTGKDAV